MSTTNLSTRKITTSQYLELKRIPFFNRRARWWMGSVLLTADLLSLVISFVLAIGLRLLIVDGWLARFSQNLPEAKSLTLQPHYQNLIPALFLFVVLFYLTGLYPGNRLSPVREMQRLTVSTSFVYLVLATTTFMEKTSEEYSRFIFALSWIFSILLLPLMRFVFRTLAIERNAWGEPVAIVGHREDVKQMANHLKKNPGIGLKPAFLFFKDECNDRSFEDIPLVEETWLSDLCVENQIECLLICAGQEHLAEKYQTFFKRVIVVKADSISQLIWVSVQDLYGVVGYEIRVKLNDPGPKFFKRLIDILGAFFGLFFLAPVIGFLVLLILLDSKGSAFFQQIRVGKDGRRFKFFKLRTMYQNADKLLEECLNKDPILKQEWDQYQKLYEDPRVTRVGKLLRRLSLDEVPQLINVLIGDMSLVGPRPFFPQQEDYYGDRLTYYKRVRPGLTGMWQISGRNEKTFHERTLLDEYYVRNWSIWLDIYILARTIPTVLLNRGAY
jgi:Undecaprenyl-phosphate galactose phosphotransferase WbaP